MTRNTKSQNEAPTSNTLTLAQTVERVRQIALLLQLALLFLLLTVMSYMPSAGAAVNVRTASFIRTEMDWTSQDGRFQLQREYNSRNLHMGLFGFGWCSNLELAITANPDGSLKVRSCNSNQDAIYQRRGPLMDEVPVFARPGTDEILVARDGQFFLYKDKAIERFDKKGRWVGHQVRTSDNRVLEDWALEYNSADFPIRLTINDQTLLFEPIFGSRRVKRISTEGFETQFLYDDQDLALVRSARRGISYKYDDFHNLIFLKELSGEATEIAYDNNSDRVIKVKTGNCIEKYNYVTQPESFRTEVLSTCQGRLPLSLKYDFRWHLQQARLSSLKIQSGESRLIATYGLRENLTSTEVAYREKAWTFAGTVPRRSNLLATVLSQLQIRPGGSI